MKEGIKLFKTSVNFIYIHVIKQMFFLKHLLGEMIVKKFNYIKLFFLLLAMLCSWGSEITLNAHQPQIFSANNGNAVAVWQDVSATNNLNMIYSNNFTFSSGLWSTPSVISSSTNNSVYPRMAGSITTGNAVAIWYSTDSNGVNSIQTSQFSASSWSTPAILSQTSSNTNPYIDYKVAISEATGNPLFAIWTELLNGQFTTVEAHGNIGGAWIFP
jgi:hypothetical protein